MISLAIGSGWILDWEDNSNSLGTWELQWSLRGSVVSVPEGRKKKSLMETVVIEGKRTWAHQALQAMLSKKCMFWLIHHF